MVNITVEIGWKFVVALGTAVGITIPALKVDGVAAERVLTHTVNASKGNVAALISAD